MMRVNLSTKILPICLIIFRTDMIFLIALLRLLCSRSFAEIKAEMDKAYYGAFGVLAGALAVGAYCAAVVGVNFFRRGFHSLRNAHYEFMGTQYYQG
jgi:hypothetical protein